MPVAVLGLIDREPFLDESIVARDDKLGVVEVVIDDAAVGPGTIFSEEGEWCVPVEELRESVLGLSKAKSSLQ